MVVFQKLEGKTTTLKFRNQKLEGKTTTLNFWNQKLEGKTTTLKNWIKRMEGNSTTPKNCVLTNFLHERSIIFLLVFSLIWFWILLRNVNCYYKTFNLLTWNGVVLWQFKKSNEGLKKLGPVLRVGPSNNAVCFT